MADKIPYPFTSREQYERSLRTTIGPEWNTPSVFSELSRPEVRACSVCAACRSLLRVGVPRLLSRA
jgi:U3 small nucleolar RNA-associated protein 14